MKFYKNKINGRILVGNPSVGSELIEIVGPNGKNPNFESIIKWNLDPWGSGYRHFKDSVRLRNEKYTEIINFKLSLKLTHFDDIPKSSNFVNKCICSAIKDDSYSYIFLISPSNSKIVSVLNKNTYTGNWELNHSNYDAYYKFLEGRKDSLVKENWITIKKYL